MFTIKEISDYCTTRYEFWSFNNISLGWYWLNCICKSIWILRDTIDEAYVQEVYKNKRQVIAVDLVSY